MTGQAGKVARGWRTTGANIVKMAQSTKQLTYEVNGSTKSINLWNEAGTDIRSTYDIVNDIAESWKDMSDFEKSALAIQLSGKNQMDVFLSTLSNFNSAQRAYATALGASGSAMKEQEAYAESLQFKLTALKAEFERLVLGDGGISSFIKGTVDAGTTVLKFANSELGQLSLVIVGLTTLFYTLANAVEKYRQAQALASTGEAVGALIKLILNGIKTFGLYGLAIAGVVGSIYGLYKAYNYLFPSVKQVNDEIKKSKQAYSDATTEVDTLEQKIKDLAKSMDDIRSKDKLEITDQNDLKRMERETAELQIQLSLARQKQALELAELDKKVQKANSRQYADKVWSVTSDHTMTGQYDENAGDYWAQVQQRTGSATQILKEYTAEMRNAQEIIEENNKQIAVYNNQMEHGGITIEEAKSKIQDLNDENKIALGTYNKNAEQVGNYVEVVGELAGTQQVGHEQAQQAIDDYVNMSSTLVTVGDETNGFAVQTQNLTDDLEENSDQADENAQKQEELAQKNEALNASLNAVSKAMKPVEKAQKEFAKNGKITSDTIIGIQSKAQKLGLDFTNLMGVLSDTDSTTQDVNDAFGSMIKQIVEASGAFDNLTEENADTVESLLEGYGVTNAYTIVQEKLKEQLVESTLASEDFEAATMDDISELQSLSKTSQVASQKLFEYVSAKIRANKITIQTDGDITNLIALANAAGVAAEKVAQAKAAVAKVEEYKSKSSVLGRAISPIKSAFDTKKNQEYKDAFDTINKIKKGTFFEPNSVLEYKYEPLSASDFIVNATNSGSGGGGGGSRGGASSSAKNALEEYKKLYQAEHEELEHMLKMDEISETEYYKRLNALNEKYFGEASGHHQDCLDEYRKNQESIYVWTKKRFEDSIKYQQHLIDRQIKALQKEKEEESDDYDDRIERLEKKRDKIVDALDEEIDLSERKRDKIVDALDEEIDLREEQKDAELDAIKEEQDAIKKKHDEVIDNIKAQIDVLKEEKSANQETWNERIAQLDAVNDELEKQKQLEEKLDALAKARVTRIKVFKNGRFVYDVDREAVSEAQKNLNEYKEQLRRERKKKALETQRDEEQKNYDTRINALTQYQDQQDKYYDNIENRLKNHYDTVNKKYQQAIDALKKQRDSEKKIYDEQIKNLEKQKNDEKKLYDDKIKNLQKLKREQEKEYQDMMDDLNDLKDSYSDALENMENVQNGFLDASKAFTYDYSKSMEENLKAFMEYATGVKNGYKELEQAGKQSNGSGGKDYRDISQWSNPAEQHQAWVDAGSPSSSSSSSKGYNTYGYGDVVTKKYKYSHASGIASVGSNEIAVVGENPNKEIVVGSRVNNGTLMSLNRGTGVINAKSTRTLAGLVNSIGGSNNLIDRNTSVVQTFSFDKIVLPNVTNANSFVDALSREFNNKAIQYGNIRR